MSANMLLFFTVLLWGVWGWADKNAVTRAHPFTIQWMYSVPYVLLIPLWFRLGARAAPESNLDAWALTWAVSASLASMTAMILLFYALQSKPASIAVSITSAYPLVTLILSVLSGEENFNTYKVSGMVLVFLGVILLQSD